MEKLNVDAINKIKLLEAKEGERPFSLLWVQAAEQSNRETQNHRYHHHAFFEIHCVIEGGMSYAFKDGIISAQAGQYIVIPPGLSHRVERLSKDFCKLTVAVDISAQGCFSSLKTWVADIDAELMHVILLIAKYASEKREYSGELITLWLQTAVYGFMENAPFKLHLSSYFTEAADPRFLKAKKYIEDNYDVCFSCDEVAEYCRLSTKQLGRLFVQYEGMGLSEFIKASKLEAAKKLLVSTYKTQKSISEELGFSSVSYFSKFFTKHEGISPGEFKRKNGLKSVE